MSGSQLIAAERQRRIDAEGWTPEHDYQHGRYDLSDAAGCYLDAARHAMIYGVPLDYFEVRLKWPWDSSWWKPSADPTRNLVKAGALTAAALDREIALSGR